MIVYVGVCVCSASLCLLKSITLCDKIHVIYKFSSGLHFEKKMRPHKQGIRIGATGGTQALTKRTEPTYS